MITSRPLSSDSAKTPTADWSVGDVVAISHPNYEGLRGIIYQLYQQPSATATSTIIGFSLLTESGENVIGWEPASWHFITRVHRINLAYTFTDVETLTTDFKSGVFDIAFKNS